MNTPWTTAELAYIIQDYFSMLIDEINGNPYNKTEHRNKLHTFLPNRNKKSLEYKHMNISAVLRDIGIPYIKGYKPLANIQRLLSDEVLVYLQVNQRELHPLFDHFAEAEIKPSAQTKKISFERILEEPPLIAAVTKVEESKPFYHTPFKINYLEREQNNRRLGEAGEALALAYEKWRLNEAGKANLADRVEWISQTEGDGAGFDILSFNNNGSDRYIEVKTTKLSKEAPIFFSLNEYYFSKEHAPQYHLYRLFRFNTKAKMFHAKGSFDDFCRVEAVAFKGRF